MPSAVGERLLGAQPVGSLPSFSRAMRPLFIHSSAPFEPARDFNINPSFRRLR